MIRGRDIIISGMQPWDGELACDTKDIACEFAKHNRVLFVNSPLDRRTLLFRRKDSKVQLRIRVLKRKEADLVRVRENLWTLNPRTVLESISGITNEFLFDWLNKINGRRLAAQISFAMKRLEFYRHILFINNDFYRSFHLKELLKPVFQIYYERDNMIDFRYWQPHGARKQADLMRQSDIVLTNSEYLAARARQFNVHSYKVGHGCDLALQGNARLQEPEETKKISRPIIGYLGALVAFRLDVEMIRYIAIKKPTWSIVLVGPEDDVFKKSDLHRMANVHFLGPKKEAEIARYIHFFDVAINPQVVNEVTVGNYPRKLDEYLSLGKATVVTRTNATEDFSEFVYEAESKESFLSAIEKALAEDSPERRELRVRFERNNTWEKVMGRIATVVEKVAREKGLEI